MLTNNENGIVILNGKRYRRVNIDGYDAEQAAYNRFMVEKHLFEQAYADMENALLLTPLGHPLPKWIRPGVLPQITKEDWKQYGEQAGMREIDNCGEAAA